VPDCMLTESEWRFCIQHSAQLMSKSKLINTVAGCYSRHIKFLIMHTYVNFKEYFINCLKINQ